MLNTKSKKEKVRQLRFQQESICQKHANIIKESGVAFKLKFAEKDRILFELWGIPMGRKRSLQILEDSKLLSAVRNGLVLATPAITCGSIALLLLSIPIPAYQQFLQRFGVISDILTLIHGATLEMISLLLLLTISYSYEQLFLNQVTGICPIVSLCAYIAFASNGAHGFDHTVFQSTWLFNAIVVALLSSALFRLFHRVMKRYRLIRELGAGFGGMVSSIVPACLVVLLFACFNILLTNAYGGPNFQLILSDAVTSLFTRLGRNIGSGLLFVLLLHIMWFFGIHGGNVLDEAAKTVFGSGIDVNMHLVQAGAAPTQIVTKTFFDTFIFFGGCGALLCLVVAIFIAEKRKSVRGLTKIATLPVLFNMNELMVFGIPVVFNLNYMIPFILTPLALTLVSFLAMATGLVPLTTQEVAWTTPIFLSGYAATGSVAGSILQLVNLAVGTAIYLPFVRRTQKRHLSTVKKRVAALTDVIVQCEKRGERPALLSETAELSSMVKVLMDDLRNALDHKRIDLFYQPHVNADGHVIGAEALMRWRYETGEYIYPSLVIALAEEAGILYRLEHYVLERACEDLQKLEAAFQRSMHISVNISANQLNRPDIVSDIRELVERHQIKPDSLGLELTEQTALSCSESAIDRLMEIRKLGVWVILDDFGMGHSSMMYLQNHQFDMVKLDGSLIREIQTNARSREIVSSIIHLSGSLHFRVMAEYVETDEQQKLLQEMGCCYYQGYLFSPAIPFERYVEYLKSHSWQ